MQKDDLKTVLFAAVVCVICSLLLSTVAVALREKQQVNEENDRLKNVLRAFGVATVSEAGEAITGEEIKQTFDAHIDEIFIDLDGNLLQGKTRDDFDAKSIASKEKSPLSLYTWKQDKAGGQPTMYAYPQYGMGLWSTVYSYIALKNDLATIVGATFFGHKETPGLGGECSTDWFQNQFAGKVLWAGGQPRNFEIVKGVVSDKYPDGNVSAVDGMSGATITGKGIQKFMNSDFRTYDKYFSKIRGS